MLKCSEMNELMSLYIDNMLSDEENVLFLQHLESCEECKKELADMQELLQLCRDIPEEDLPENFRAELHEKLVEVKAQETRNSKFAFYRNRYIQVASTIAACLLMFFVVKGVYDVSSIQPVRMRDASVTPSTENFSTADSTAKSKSLNGNNTLTYSESVDTDKQAGNASPDADSVSELARSNEIKAAILTQEDRSAKSVEGSQNLPPDQGVVTTSGAQAGSTGSADASLKAVPTSSGKIAAKKPEPSTNIKPGATPVPNADVTASSIEMNRSFGGETAYTDASNNKAINQAAQNSITVNTAEDISVKVQKINSIAEDNYENSENNDSGAGSDQPMLVAAAPNNPESSTQNTTMLNIKIPVDKYESFVEQLTKELGADIIEVGKLDSNSVVNENGVNYINISITIIKK